MATARTGPERAVLDESARGAPRTSPQRLVENASAAWDLVRVVDAVVTADIPAAFPDRREDPSFVSMLRGSIAENLTALRNYLGGRVDLSKIVLVNPLEFARVQAELGIPQAALQASYRTGMRTIWDNWATYLREFSVAAGSEEDVVAQALQLSTGRMLEWFDFVVQTVDQAYAEREHVLRRTGSSARAETVREILGGELPAAPRELYSVLRYDLTANHVAIQLSDVSDVVAQKMAERVRSATGATDSLLVRMTVSTAMVWLARPKVWTPAALGRLRDALVSSKIRAAVADPADGVAGFRAGFDDVTRVEAVRAQWLEAPDVLMYEDVRLEALVLANDIQEVRRFVCHELGPLADDTAAAARLRETLLASFTHGSHVAAAESLHLHEHTVRNRLARVETVLGGPVIARRIELQVAMRLHRLVG